MKKKDLYKLVKQSLKEVLQEQRRDRRLGSDDFFVDPQTGELIPKDIAGAAISTATSAKPIKFKDDFINPFESGDDDVPTYTPSEADNPFTIWYVNTTTGECTEASVTDGYICDDGDADG